MCRERVNRSREYVKELFNWPIKRQNAKIFLKDVLLNAVINFNAT